MSEGSLIDWKAKSEIVHNEMDNLLKTTKSEFSSTLEERRVQRMQFMALIERRNTAARKFLHTKQQSSRILRAGRHTPAASSNLDPSSPVT